jgi:hypothetical protein
MAHQTADGNVHLTPGEAGVLFLEVLRKRGAVLLTHTDGTFAIDFSRMSWADWTLTPEDVEQILTYCRAGVEAILWAREQTVQ